MKMLSWLCLIKFCNAAQILFSVLFCYISNLFPPPHCNDSTHLCTEPIQNSTLSSSQQLLTLIISLIAQVAVNNHLNHIRFAQQRRKTINSSVKQIKYLFSQLKEDIHFFDSKEEKCSCLQFFTALSCIFCSLCFFFLYRQISLVRSE